MVNHVAMGACCELVGRWRQQLVYVIFSLCCIFAKQKLTNTCFLNLGILCKMHLGPMLPITKNFSFLVFDSYLSCPPWIDHDAGMLVSRGTVVMHTNCTTFSISQTFTVHFLWFHPSITQSPVIDKGLSKLSHKLFVFNHNNVTISR